MHLNEFMQTLTFSSCVIKKRTHSKNIGLIFKCPFEGSKGRSPLHGSK